MLFIASYILIHPHQLIVCFRESEGSSTSADVGIVDIVAFIIGECYED